MAKKPMTFEQQMALVIPIAMCVVVGRFTYAYPIVLPIYLAICVGLVEWDVRRGYTAVPRWLSFVTMVPAGIFWTVAVFFIGTIISWFPPQNRYYRAPKRRIRRTADCSDDL